MPETPVEEHGDAPSRPHYVASKALVRQRAAINPKSISPTVKSASDCHFDARTARLLGLHLSANVFTRRRQHLGHPS